MLSAPGNDVSASSIPRSSFFTAGQRHDGCIQVSPSCTPMHNARPVCMLVQPWQPLRGVTRAQSAIPTLPETSKESRHCVAIDQYITQKANPTCINPVTSPSCAAGLVDTLEGHPSYGIQALCR
ncbi:hypothetical protein ACQKWADRAFT_204747 [Trichoderma austrokoningii]